MSVISNEVRDLSPLLFSKQIAKSQRGRAATEIRIISRKARRDPHVKSSNFLEA